MRRQRVNPQADENPRKDGTVAVAMTMTMTITVAQGLRDNNVCGVPLFIGQGFCEPCRTKKKKHKKKDSFVDT
jgi:hypothetical protein